MPHRDLDVLDAAELADERIVALIDKYPRRLVHVAQLRDAGGSLPGNIAEGFGRRKGPDRVYKLEVARAEAEEANRYLGTNFRTDRITPGDYWPIHNLLTTIVKMIDSLIASMSRTPPRARKAAHPKKGRGVKAGAKKERRTGERKREETRKRERRAPERP
jgi:four helix bundle protein